MRLETAPASHDADIPVNVHSPAAVSHRLGLCSVLHVEHVLCRAVSEELGSTTVLYVLYIRDFYRRFHAIHAVVKIRPASVSYGLGGGVYIVYV